MQTSGDGAAKAGRGPGHYRRTRHQAIGKGLLRAVAFHEHLHHRHSERLIMGFRPWLTA
jgi:hypothetical protein